MYLVFRDYHVWSTTNWNLSLNYFIHIIIIEYIRTEVTESMTARNIDTDTLNKKSQLIMDVNFLTNILSRPQTYAQKNIYIWNNCVTSIKYPSIIVMVIKGLKRTKSPS